MPKYFVIDPEIAGEMGPGTEMDDSVHPPIVSHLEYVVSGWSGDDIVQSYPCFMVTPQLGEAIRVARLSGGHCEEHGISVVSEDNSTASASDLPVLWLLKVNGKPHSDDFGLTEDTRLVVSQRALDVLHKFSIANCVISACA
jgi:hypothetical protein